MNEIKQIKVKNKAYQDLVKWGAQSQKTILKITDSHKRNIQLNALKLVLKAGVTATASDHVEKAENETALIQLLGVKSSPANNKVSHPKKIIRNVYQKKSALDQGCVGCDDETKAQNEAIAKVQQQKSKKKALSDMRNWREVAGFFDSDEKLREFAKGLGMDEWEESTKTQLAKFVYNNT